MVDVSRNVVAGLLVLVILVSGVGTYYALWGGTAPQPSVGGQAGQVKLSIAASAEQGDAQPSYTTGNVAITITPREVAS